MKKTKLILIVFVSVFQIQVGMAEEKERGSNRNATLDVEVNMRGNESLLNGIYYVAGYEKENYLLEFEFDGNGSGNVTFLYSSDNETTGAFPITYSVEENRRLNIAVLIEEEEIPFTGIVSADGNGFTAVSDHDVSGDVDIWIGFKSSSSASAALLNGSYYVSMFENNDDDCPDCSYNALIEFEFDGNGSGTLTPIFSSDEEDYEVEDLPFEYSVEENGRLLISIPFEDEELSYKGVVSADGNALTWVVDYSFTLETDIAAGFRSTSGASEALLKGQYFVTGFDDTGDDDANNFLSLAEFDGDGGGTWVSVYSSAEYDLSDTVSFTYTIEENGQLTISAIDDDEDFFTGIVSMEGDGFTMVNEDVQDGEQGIWIGFKSTGMPTSVIPDPGLPSQYSLTQNYPNPFNPSTVISYQIPVNSEVRLQVFDILGRKVATLVNERKPAGSYSARFDASHLSSGMYIYRIEAESFVQTRKMMLIK